jgi:hypothetical protein
MFIENIPRLRRSEIAEFASIIKDGCAPRN